MMTTDAERRSTSGNKFLGCLSDEMYLQLQPHMKTVELSRQQTVFDPGGPIRHIYFPDNCVVCGMVIMRDGATVETNMIGLEGAVGITALFGGDVAHNWMRVLIQGNATRVSTEVLRELLSGEGDELRLLLMLYYRTRINQISLRAICNARHRLFERLCTWLLMLRDRIEQDDIPLTQELIARQLGVRRAGVNEAVGELEGLGIIGHGRGYLRILNRPAMEGTACACYGAVAEELEWFSTGCPEQTVVAATDDSTNLVEGRH
jgi:CRP-like cAMP-binding protein